MEIIQRKALLRHQRRITEYKILLILSPEVRSELVKMKMIKAARTDGVFTRDANRNGD